MHDALSSSLSHYFHRMIGPGQAATLSTHISQGADCVSAADFIGLRALLDQVKAKATEIKDSERLRQRIEMLVQYVHESVDAKITAAHREAAFVLYYFIKGNDLIPDSVPEIGLLDDALLVETAVNRNLLALRAHWEERQRVWPENL